MAGKSHHSIVSAGFRSKITVSNGVHLLLVVYVQVEKESPPNKVRVKLNASSDGNFESLKK
jgi:hypothetical protein